MKKKDLPEYMDTDTDIILTLLKQGNREAFTTLFRSLYKDLVMFAGRFIPDKSSCEDIVQSIFMKLWIDRETINIETSIKSYLLQSVRNGCLDELRHRKIVLQHQSDEQLSQTDIDTDAEDRLNYLDLQRSLKQALKKIPDTLREAYELHRFRNMKYKDIAAKLNVSERTVEVRISKAIAMLRQYLNEYLTVSLCCVMLKKIIDLWNIVL
ncbi:MAG: RNA polymerase sigma-70 factor [Tannerella sp.]|jgi:RNA polymerase sigma-70 factor (ECF subfamily)|nr:RNA polymerase sigma-70 factor [Tannerella sp.]